MSGRVVTAKAQQAASKVTLKKFQVQEDWGYTFLKEADAVSLVKKTNVPLLKAGHEVTVSPGVTLRRMKVGASSRYVLATAPGV